MQLLMPRTKLLPPLPSAAAANAAAAAVAIFASNKARRHVGNESSPSSTSSAANNNGNSFGGGGGIRHRRSRSGDAAAASLVTGCSDWRGMESLAKGCFGIGTAASSDASIGRRKSYKGISSGNARHRRSRSGDAAAASLMTGGNDWKGMEM
jgi:hypothetical protein